MRTPPAQWPTQEERDEQTIRALRQENNVLRSDLEQTRCLVGRLRERVEELQVSKLMVGRIFERATNGFDYALRVVATYETPNGVVIEVTGSPSTSGEKHGS